MQIADLHAGWSKESVVRFFDDRVIPSLPTTDMGPLDGAGGKLVRFAMRSAMFRLVAGGRVYAAKVWGPSTPPAHTAEAAYDFLRKLHKRDPSQVLFPTSRPVTVLPDVGTLVMEWIDAPNVRDAIVRVDRERGRAGVVSAFRWLEEFHRSERPVGGLVRWRLRVGVPLQALKRNDTLIPSEDRPAVARATECLERLARDLAALRCEFRHLHFDATCANFLYDGTRVIGIDMHEVSHDDPLVDYCNLLVDADALLNAGTEVVPPLAIGADLQTLVLAAPLVQATPGAFERVRLHLMSTALAKYGQRLATRNPAVKRERGRHLAVASALASDAFVAAAAVH